MKKQFDLAAETNMAILQDLIVGRAQPTGRVESGAKAQSADPGLHSGSGNSGSDFEQNRGAIERLANVESMTFVENSLSKLSGARSTARFDVHVVYEKKIDVAAERERLRKELAQIEKEIGQWPAPAGQ